MKAFTMNNVEYSVKQDFGKTGIQYRARYPDGMQAWTYLPGKRHTRKEIVQAFLELEEQQLGDDNYE